MNKYRHFYLYAKGHYKTTLTLMDLKAIQGEWSGVDPECLMKRDVAHLLIEIAYPHIAKSAYSFREFLKHVDPAYLWAFPAFVKEVGDNYDYQGAIIHSCLSALMATTVDEIDGDLGDPDPQILPISEARLKRLEEKQFVNEKEKEAISFENKLFGKIGHSRQEEEYFLSLNSIMENVGFSKLGSKIKENYLFFANEYMKYEECEEIRTFNPDGEILEFSTVKLEAIHIPGHSPGHTAFVIESNKSNSSAIKSFYYCVLLFLLSKQG